ncbi:uncharacterized protein LOC116294596 isoform X2 [Actinia tenebrosa]|uniref:Uncharacterized protein LOC116294596 isoform X2 n=1 Tax=Actinia tenebrosa TaxID=6105 RepID=A0A6P8HNY9_ACTTE|nr:uncharacterized protein LOC116294596 isoform X2 [Actinia tenebrosa]
MKNRVYSTLFFLLFWFGVLFSVAEAFLIKSRYACQGDKLRIRCKSSLIIRIFSANYGRTEPGSSICPNVNTTYTTCKSSKAMDIVTNRCTNKARCNIKADSTMFPDPCPNTFKYLDVIYGCVPRPATMTTAAPRKRHKHKTKPRYQATTTAEWLTDYETTTQSTTTKTPIKTTMSITTSQSTSTRKTIKTQMNITTTIGTNLSIAASRNPTPSAEVKKTNVDPTPTSMHSTTSPPPKQAKSGYIQRGQPKYVLVLFLSGVAIATVLLLVLLLGLHLKGRRTKKFVVQREDELEPNDEADDEIEEDVSDDENKNITIQIQGEDEETKQISVKPGDIIIIDSKDNVDNDDSEDLGYMSEIVRYYNSRNMVQDDGKQSLTCETPSVNSIPNSEVGDKREPQYDDVPKDNGVCVT